jgi:signal transduction histidine kinase
VNVQLKARQLNRSAGEAIQAVLARNDMLVIAVAISLGIVVWAIVNIANGWVGFAKPVPQGLRGGMEASISLARLFAAMVLMLLVADGNRGRLRWVAAGFVVLGLGQLIFGYIEPILVTEFDLNRSLYEMILVRSLAGALFVIGLAPVESPRFSVRTAAVVAFISTICAIAYRIVAKMNKLPQLVRIDSLEDEARLRRIAPMSWMTGWHWAFAVLTCGLAIAAATAALARNRQGEIGGWLPIGIVLLAGSELHDSLWPSAYGNSVLMNTADVLRFAMAVVVVAGGTLELGRITSERAALLAAEKEQVRRLEELAKLKADFTAMVAHELGYPLSAIRRLTEMMSRDGLDPELRNQTAATIIKETNALDALVADVQATMTIERGDFGVDLGTLELGDLIDDAIDLSKAHSAERPPLEIVLTRVDRRDRVRADRDRIGQVLRNLLYNASKYAPAGTKISLLAASTGNGRVRIEVVDRGPGIDPDDRARIFEKFTRGRNRGGEQVDGAGLGLYLSRGITRAHGSDLTVRSIPSAGSAFAFELERAPAVLKRPAR